MVSEAEDIRLVRLTPVALESDRYELTNRVSCEQVQIGTAISMCARSQTQCAPDHIYNWQNLVCFSLRQPRLRHLNIRRHSAAYIDHGIVEIIGLVKGEYMREASFVDVPLLSFVTPCQYLEK